VNWSSPPKNKTSKQAKSQDRFTEKIFFTAVLDFLGAFLTQSIIEESDLTNVCDA